MSEDREEKVEDRKEGRGTDIVSRERMRVEHRRGKDRDQQE